MRLVRTASLVAVTAVVGSMLSFAPLAASAEPRQAPVSAVTAEDPDPEEELQVAIATILGDPDTGRAVREAAIEALDDGSVEAMTYFLETGRWIAQHEDDHVAVATILGDPDSGRAVRREAIEALEDGSAAALAYFLETGRWIAQDEDNQVAIATILGRPGSSAALRQAAIAALEGTPEDRAYFLETGQYEVD